MEKNCQLIPISCHECFVHVYTHSNLIGDACDTAFGEIRQRQIEYRFIRSMKSGMAVYFYRSKKYRRF